MRLLAFLLLLYAQSLLAGPVIIAHPGMPAFDLTTLQRIYTGKVVEVGGVRVTPLNLPPGNALRAEFLERYLNQDDAKYIGYWTVRRYVGKGTPPRELSSTAQILDFISKTAGTIGYIDDADVNSDVEVLLTNVP